MAGILSQAQPRAILGEQMFPGWGVMPRSVLGGQGDMYSGYTPTKYATPGQTYPADRFMGGVASVASAPVRIPFNMGMGIGSLLDQANQAMPWGGNDPSAIGIDVEQGSIDPNVMVPFATNMAGLAATGGIASPKPAGALGIFGGRLAKTADQAALAKAEQMAAQGASRDAIWAETGWFQGVDGKWRFEIPDNAAYVDLQRDGDFYRARGMGLGDESPLRHPEAAAAYDASDLMFQMDPEASYISGSFSQGHPATKTHFAVSPEINVRATDEYGLRQPTLHELQHWVQRKEGFAVGDSPRNYAVDSLKEQAIRPYDEQIRQIMDESPAAAEAFRARNRKQAELFSSNRARPATEAELAELDRLDNALQSTEAGQRLDGLDWERRSLANMPESHWKDEAFRRYQRSAGETEGRNVEARMDMTPEQRRATPPWATQDVPDADQIIRMSLDGPQSSIISSNPKESSPLGAAILGGNEPTGAPFGIRAYHGSPHDFDRFSMEKIGTGEGAQAYGHGLYFAENQNVARDYKAALSGLIDGKKLTQSGLSTKAQAIVDDAIMNGNPTTVSDVLAYIDSVKAGKPYSTQRELAAIADELAPMADKPVAAGRMYEVSINASPDEFLDWDKPLSEQSGLTVDKVVEQLSTSPPSGGMAIEASAAEPASQISGLFNASGMQFSAKREANGYRPVATPGPDAPANLRQRVYVETFPTREAAVNHAKVKWLAGLDGQRLVGELERLYGRERSAEILRSAGIKGIRYKDAGSRGGAEGGTSNYVVFDDNIIDILKKYGIAGLMAGGGAAAALGGSSDTASAAQPSYKTGGRF